MLDKYGETLHEWQERNCTGCQFADEETVGTGRPCCTFVGICETGEEGECKEKRQK